MKKISLFLLGCISSTTIFFGFSQAEEFSIETAFIHIKDLKESIYELRKEVYLLDQEAGEKKHYTNSREQIVSVINDMAKMVQVLNSHIQRKTHLEKELQQKTNGIQSLRQDKESIKDNIRELTQLIQQLHNEIYDHKQKKDNIKLFLKGENISQIASQEVYLQLLIKQLDTLLQTLQKEEQQQEQSTKDIYKKNKEYRQTITYYQTAIERLEQKEVYVRDFIELYKKNQEELNQRIEELFQTRAEIDEHIRALTQKVINGELSPQSRNRGEKKEQLLSLDRRGGDPLHSLAWPLLPISKIAYYFADSRFQETYNMRHRGLQVITKKGTPIHAPLDGIIVKNIDNLGFGTNWMMIAHKEKIVTSYLYIDQTTVKEGDIVKQGQVIGYSAGEEHDSIGKEPQITFNISKNGQYMDPLELLDLSVIADTKIIPDHLSIKYHKDIQKMPIDITNTTFIEGDTTQERRINFLKTRMSGVYRSRALREEAGENHAIDPIFVSCIVIAETSGGKHFATQHNPGNVGNFDDPSIRTAMDSPLIGIQAIYDTLDNKMLGDLMKLEDLSGFGKYNRGLPVYATSQYNRHNNIQRCLTSIYGYYIPKNRPFRTAPRQRYSKSFEAFK